MAWTIGYPSAFVFLDEEHEEIGRRLEELRTVSDDQKRDARRLVTNLLNMVKDHAGHEETIMVEHDYPDYDLHKLHHQSLIDGIDIISEIFGRSRMTEYADQIATHIEHKMSEEIAVDQLLADYLCERQQPV